ncbi:MAG TPA: CoA pyrophosphatase [Candidatus Competibacteraceae bacterium]|nr:CoA pyrophosphatase [Candidatus Competibacteraceae bacterium]HRY19532.1 CoA pyrophosphatase [Candidatus Competibacteraceae bacterium]
MEREERALMPAAVLVPLVERTEGYTVLLTQRTDHLEHHAGQISFPGGRTEEEDASPVETALREAEEEIGLHRRHVVEIAGFLDLYQTVTGFLVTPVVGFITPPFELALDDFEVAEAFEVPLEFILDSRHHEHRSMLYKGQQRQYYVIPYENRFIWGATAAMLVNFAQRLTGGNPLLP